MPEGMTVQELYEERDHRCGHNFRPEACPYEHCAYRDTLQRLRALEEAAREAKRELRCACGDVGFLVNDMTTEERGTCSCGAYAAWKRLAEVLGTKPCP